MALHASNHRKEQGRWWYDAKVRALLFQCLAIAAVIGFLFYIVNNALTNLATRGITTGFDFLGNTAGFGILQSLIPYDETYTFGRTFVVGLLNTLLVSVLGILFATLLGFALGVARLSRNWLVAKIAAVYIETFRNIPLLLQIFFWYFSVLRTLPSPRQSVDIGGLAFLNVRGFYLPKPLFEEGFGYVLWALVLAVLLSWGLGRWARRRQALTGRIFPFWRCVAALVMLLPGITFLLAGSPLSWSVPALQGFNFRGGADGAAGARGPLAGAHHLYGGLHRRDSAIRHPGHQQGADGGGFRPRALAHQDAAAGDHSPGHAGHHSSLDQPVSEPHQELLPGDRHRLPGSGLGVHGDDSQPDRAGHRGHRHDHGGLSRHQYHHLGADEHLQPQNDAG